jgi:hypothetical protein
MLCFVLSFYLQSCNWGNPCGDDYQSVNTNYFISDANKASIPFRPDGKDTLTYISDAGDTAVLYGVGVAQYTNRVSINRTSNPDCPEYDYGYCENIEYLFEGNKNKELNSLSFKAYLWLEDEVTNSYEQLGGFILNGNIKSGLPGYNKGTPDYIISVLNNEARYYVKVVLSGQENMGILIAKREAHRDINSDTLLIYNKTLGVLQIKLNNNLWKLDI